MEKEMRVCKKRKQDNIEVGAGSDEEGQRPVLEQEMKHEENLMNENWVSCETVEEHQMQAHEAILVVLEGKDGEDCQETRIDIDDVEEGNLGKQEEQTEIQVNQRQEILWMVLLLHKKKLKIQKT
ncbi:hypothetical protein GH714_010141 [Hevea brasiliensis]|uniref:Uncharacterized protein n=1 Tax=Hevea brasiliensis TaxID=3981 RepID=A0A6A6KCJ1_HEVBR|nr:hypothetical protein GH714_010141 [Hevea brasiliensis]